MSAYIHAPCPFCADRSAKVIATNAPRRHRPPGAADE